MDEKIKVFGFTLLRNAAKYDYCFTESLKSLSPLVEYITIALGNSDDGTESMISQLPKIKIVNTIWDQNLRDSGLILSQQTNIALNELRSAEKNNESSWAIYLQADEVLHENDYELIAKDIQYANNNGYDSVSFRYKHFWMNHNTLTVGKKWYPIEIRAIKLNSNILSVKDAQGFQGQTKTFFSNAFIYHYGHVREERLLKLKKEAFHRLYNSDENVVKAHRKEEKKYKQGLFLTYLASHPPTMEARINRFGDIFTIKEIDEIWILDNKNKYDENFRSRILADKINWINKVSECPLKFRRNKLIISEPNWWQKILYFSKVKNRPESHLGPNWTNEYVLTLKLSEKSIGVL